VKKSWSGLSGLSGLSGFHGLFIWARQARQSPIGRQDNLSNNLIRMSLRVTEGSVAISSCFLYKRNDREMGRVVGD